MIAIFTNFINQVTNSLNINIEIQENFVFIGMLIMYDQPTILNICN